MIVPGLCSPLLVGLVSPGIPNESREGNSAPSTISMMLAITTGTNAIAGKLKKSHKAPPMKGPTKATP